MADRKITDLTALTTPASADVLPIVDVSEAAAADKNKKITVGELFKGVPDGTAAAPAIAFESDDGNGIFLSTTDTVGIATNGSSRMTVSTTAVTSTLPVIVPDGTAAAPSIAFTGSGTDTGVYSPGVDQVAISTGGTGRLFVASDGTIKISSTEIQQTTADNFIRISGSDGAGNGANIIAFGESHSSAPGRLSYSAVGTGSHIFATGGFERLYITSDGKVGLGTSSPTSLLTVGAASTANPAADVTVNSSAVDQYRLKLTSSAYNADTKWLGLGFGYHDNYLKAGIIAEAKDNNARTNLHFCLDGNANSDNAGLGDSKMVITYGGTVGIGVANPSSASLVIDSQGGNGSGIRLIGRASNDGSEIDFFADDNSTRLGYLEFNNTATTLNTETNVPVRFFQNGGEAFRVDSSKRLLIGTSTSRSVDNEKILQIEGTDLQTSSMSLTRNTNDSSPPNITLGKSRGTATGSNTIVQDGDSLGIIVFCGADGTDLNSIAAGISGQVDGTPGSNDMPGRLVFSTTADGASSPTERMRIKQNGAIDVNAAYAPSGNVDITTWGRSGFGVAAAVRYKDATTSMEFYSPTGHTVAYTTTSDYRLKENIQELQDAAERLKDLPVYRFNFNNATGAQTVDGFLAHEVQVIVPEAVTGTKDEVDADGNPVYQGIDQSKLVPLLTAALQEALAEIESLKARVTALEP